MRAQITSPSFWILWIILNILFPTVQAQESIKEIKTISKRLIPDGYDGWPEDTRLVWITKQLQSTVDPLEIYALNRVLFNEKYSKGEYKEAAAICNAIKPIKDDFHFRTACVDAMEGLLNHDEMRQLLYEILQDTRDANAHAETVEALSSIAWLQSQDGDISEALTNYAHALEIVPKDEERLRFNVLFNLATNYVVHGNEEYIRKGIKLLEEIKITGAERARNLKSDDAAYFLADSQMAAFNLGIAYTLHLHEYEKAIPEFEYAKAMGDTHRVESLTFSALAAAQIGRFELAKKLIAEIQGEESRNAVKEGYLKCYRSLAIKQWNPSQKLTSCFTLLPDTTLEVLVDINKRLVRLKGQAEELDGLRAYVKMYEEKIEPEYKKRAAKAASNVELKRLETEAKLKDEKIALGEKIKTLLYVVMLVSFLLLAMVLVVLRSKRVIRQQAADLDQQKQNLQHVLDNIDEGIIAIDRNSKVSSVYSRSSMQILRNKPDKLSISELLQEMGMAGDALASAQEVFHAVMGEDAIAWDMNNGLLPQQGNIHDEPFQFFWKPIINDEKVCEIIVSLRNASATIALQKEENTRNRILAVIKSGTIGQKFIWDLSVRLDTVRKGINNDGAQNSLRLAHTIKGEARSLGFGALQDHLHLFEQSLLQDDMATASEHIKQVEQESMQLHEAFQLIKSHGDHSRSNALMGLVQTVLADANRRLNEAGFDFISDLHLNWVDLTSEEVTALRDVLIHGVANSIDHGYLIAKKRNLVPDQQARLNIQLHQKGDMIHFSIIDHGIGIDWKALEDIARKRNWTPPKESDLADIVFVDKVSTVAEIQVSKTSGRGIGMAAVAEAVKSLSGEIKFGPGFNHRGARLDIKWNHQRMIDMKAAS